MSLVSLDDLNHHILELIQSYTQEMLQAMEKQLDQTADQILEYLQANAPRSGQSNGFADSFVAISNGEGITKTITIFSKSKGRITHLLEFGFTHRGGKYVGPKPFLRPAFETYAPKMVEAIRSIIISGGKR